MSLPCWALQYTFNKNLRTTGQKEMTVFVMFYINNSFEQFSWQELFLYSICWTELEISKEYPV